MKSATPNKDNKKRRGCCYFAPYLCACDSNSRWGQERVSEQKHTSSIITKLLWGHRTPTLLPTYAKNKLWRAKGKWNKNKHVEQSKVSVLSQKSFAFAGTIPVSLFKQQENINGAAGLPQITFSLSQRAQRANNERANAFTEWMMSGRAWLRGSCRALRARWALSPRWVTAEARTSPLEVLIFNFPAE